MKLDFTTFVLSVASGVMEELEKGGSLPFVQHNIDLLELWQEKTNGNRTPDENKLLEQVLFECRMRFVKVSQESSKKS